MQAVVTNSVHVDVHVSPEQLRSIEKCLIDEIERVVASKEGRVINANDHHFGCTLKDGPVTITFHPPRHLDELVIGKGWSK